MYDKRPPHRVAAFAFSLLPQWNMPSILLVVGLLLFLSAVVIAAYAAGRADSTNQHELDMRTRLAALQELAEVVVPLALQLHDAGDVAKIYRKFASVRASLIDVP